MRRALCIAIGALALSVALCLPASAQNVARRQVGVHWHGGAPSLDFSGLDLADRAVREKLDSGLPQTLLMRVFAYRANGQPIAMAPRACRVTYDLWEERYRVQIQERGAERVVSHATLDSVLRSCLVARRFVVGEASQYAPLSGQSIYFAAILELNPLSPDTVQRLRRWLARPAGGTGASSGAFYGSFVSLFVNHRIGSAERTLRFRSQDVRVP